MPHADSRQPRGRTLPWVGAGTMATVLALVVLFGGASPSLAVAGSQPVVPCEQLASLTLTNTTINSAAVVPASGTTPAFCRVRLTVTHPPAGDQVNVDICMPVSGWNGRFQGTGGGGYSGGGTCSAAAVRAGYSTASTDTGHVGGSGNFALDPDGRLNWQLIKDNAYLGIHDSTPTSSGRTTPT